MHALVLQGDQVRKGQVLGAIEQLGTIVDVKVSVMWCAGPLWFDLRPCHGSLLKEQCAQQSIVTLCSFERPIARALTAGSLQQAQKSGVVLFLCMAIVADVSCGPIMQLQLSNLLEC